MSVIVYETLEASRDDPDVRPAGPPASGMWVWWRTGPHPQGVWQAMELNPKAGGKDGLAALRENWDQHPIFQDQAFGDRGDFGNFSCHACGYTSDGYPEPNHMTDCDGICTRAQCNLHGPGGRENAVAELMAAVAWARSRGVPEEEIRKAL